MSDKANGSKIYNLAENDLTHFSTNPDQMGA